MTVMLRALSLRRSSSVRILRRGFVRELRRLMRRWRRQVQTRQPGSYLDDVGGF